MKRVNKNYMEHKIVLGVSKPRTWEDHKRLTMSYDEKFDELNSRFVDLSNFPVGYNEGMSLERKFEEMLGTTIDFQHKYLQTNSPLENTTVDLITDMETTQEEYLRWLNSNPHRGVTPISHTVDNYSCDDKVYKHKITKDDILNSDSVIAYYCKCFPPNLIEIHGTVVRYYHGLEEGLMCWDQIDIRKLVKFISKWRKMHESNYVRTYGT